MSRHDRYQYIRLGDLRILSKLCWYHSNGHRSPLAEVIRDTGLTKDAIRGARDRLELAFGGLFLTGQRGGTSMVPNAMGESLGASFVLFENLVALLRTDDVDHAALLDEILDLVARVQVLIVPPRHPDA